MTWPRHEHDHVTHGELNKIVRSLREEICQIKGDEVSTQADVDAVVAQVNQVSADLDTAKTSIQAEVDNLAAQVAAGGALNLEPLKAAVALLDPAVVALGSVTPSPPADPAPPADPPVDSPAPDAPAPDAPAPDPGP